LFFHGFKFYAKKANFRLIYNNIVLKNANNLKITNKYNTLKAEVFLLALIFFYFCTRF